jgi:hypothetical protein
MVKTLQKVMELRLMTFYNAKEEGIGLFGFLVYNPSSAGAFFLIALFLKAVVSSFGVSYKLNGKGTSNAKRL